MRALFAMSLGDGSNVDILLELSTLTTGLGFNMRDFIYIISKSCFGKIYKLEYLKLATAEGYLNNYKSSLKNKSYAS